MTKGFHKKKSKRMPAKRRYNIEKKVREHNRKLKKQTRKNSGLKRKTKDPGIPNSLPFKEQVIKEAQAERQREEERRQLVRDQNSDRRKQSREEQSAKHRKLDDLKSEVEAKTREFEAKTREFESRVKNDNSEDQSEDKTSNLKSYYKEFHKVVDASDVVIQVLDARDPIGTRCPHVEQHVVRAGANKRLILLLNKADLVPRDNLVAWLKHVRREWPAIAFKASTQNQSSGLSQSRVRLEVASDDLLHSSRCLGADALLRMLANYSRNKDIKTSITVGVVGFPNVGKSSVINSLKRSRACAVGATPGVTKSMQAVALDKRIKLLDSPGVVFSDCSQMALRNAVSVDSLSDPTAVVESLLRRVSRQDLQLFYRLPLFSDVHQLLALLAKRFGKLRKGGLLDTEAAARRLIHDWNGGKIKFFTVPPEDGECHVKSEIVAEMSKEFDIEGLDEDIGRMTSVQ